MNNIISNSFSKSSTSTYVLANDRDQTIWSELKKRIGDKKITDILIASPFYDKEGVVLKELKQMFPDAQIKMIYDEQGTIPHLVEDASNLKCYPWSSITAHSMNHLSSGRRLHAKFILMSDENGDEYLLFGSANATKSGLGISKDNSHNVELSILAQDSDNLSKNIGLIFDNIDHKKISEIKTNNETLEEPNGLKSPKEATVVYAEQNKNKVLVLLNKEIKKEIFILLFSKKGECLYKEKFDNSNNKILKIALPSNGKHSFLKISYLALNNGTHKTLVYQANSLRLDNPDARSELVRNTLSDIGLVDFGTLSDKFMTIFNEFIESHKSNNHGVQQHRNESESDKFYHISEFNEKERSSSHNSSNNIVSDGILTLLKALNEQLHKNEEPSISSEAFTTNSSKESELTDYELEEIKQKKLDKDPNYINKRIRGYRLYFKRVIRYYKHYYENFVRLKNKEEVNKIVIDKYFLSNWLFVTAVAVHLIYSDSKTEALDNDSKTTEIDLDSKTTILPSKSKSGLTIHEIISSIIPKIVGALTYLKTDLTDFLDLDQRIEAAVTIVILIHLKHWDDNSKFQTLCKNIINLFQMDEPKTKVEFKRYFFKQASLFQSDAIKENDWRYYLNFSRNYEVFRKYIY